MNDTTIIAVAGRKQSGKSSLCAFIQATLAMKEHNEQYAGEPAGQGEGPLPSVRFSQLPDGTIVWYEIDDSPYTGRSVLRPLDDGFVEFCKLNKGPAVVYSFADVLKELCVNVLGLRHEQCYGTDDEKNSLTHIKWDNMPAFIRWICGGMWLYSNCIGEGHGASHTREDLDVGEIGDEELYDFARYQYGIIYDKLRSGPMTGREVMQVFGTDIMRKMFFNDIWVKATIKKIEREKPAVVLIADMRFRTEFQALHEAGAYVIRLERNITHDTHTSEVDFDGFDFLSYPRTLIITSEADLEAKNAQAIQWLNEPLKLAA